MTVKKELEIYMMKTANEYESYAEKMIPLGAVECVENGMKYLLVNFENYIFEAVFPGYVEA